MIRMKGDHHAKTPSYFAVLDRPRYPNAVRCQLGRVRRLREIVKQMFGPSPVDAPNDA